MENEFRVGERWIYSETDWFDVIEIHSDGLISIRVVGRDRLDKIHPSHGSSYRLSELHQVRRILNNYGEV